MRKKKQACAARSCWTRIAYGPRLMLITSAAESDENDMGTPSNTVPVLNPLLSARGKEKDMWYKKFRQVVNECKRDFGKDLRIAIPKYVPSVRVQSLT